MKAWWGMAACAALMLGAGNAQAARHHKKHASASHAAAGPPSEQKVLQLFEVIHISDVLRQMNDQMAPAMAQTLPCVPASYWQGFIDTAAGKALLQRMVPVYQAHFTAGDVDGLLKFYRSPLGQKVIAEMPAAMAEAARLGQQWGGERRQQMLGELQRRGTLDDQGRCPADPASSASSARFALPAAAGSASTPRPSGH